MVERCRDGTVVWYLAVLSRSLMRLGTTIFLIVVPSRVLRFGALRGISWRRSKKRSARLRLGHQVTAPRVSSAPLGERVPREIACLACRDTTQTRRASLLANPRGVDNTPAPTAPGDLPGCAVGWCGLPYNTYVVTGAVTMSCMDYDSIKPFRGMA